MNTSEAGLLFPIPFLRVRLAFMMFLQYAIWGAWLPILYPFLLGHRGFSLEQTGLCLAAGAVGAIFGPFIAGQLADRNVATEKLLAISHFVGALLVFMLATAESFPTFVLLSGLYGFVYAPTLSLTNSLAFAHITDRDRDFGPVRMFGTIGWIVAGILVGQFLFRTATIDQQMPAPNVQAVALVGDPEGGLDAAIDGNRLLVGVNVSGSSLRDAMRERLFELLAESDATRDLDRESRTDLASTLVPATGPIAVDRASETVEIDAAEVERALAVAAGRHIQGRLYDGSRVAAFHLSALLGMLMALYCLTLPNTPPSIATAGREPMAWKAALAEIRLQPLVTLFLIAIPVSVIHQFYFVFTSQFVSEIQTKAQSDGVDAFAGAVNQIVGVGGGGLMTIGQMTEIAVLAMMPLLATILSRKSLLAIGLCAYAARMALFAFFPELGPVLLGVALHGLCFGCFVFVAFMVVDEQTTPDVRATAQSLMGLVIFGIGIIIGSWFSTAVVGNWATVDGAMDYTRLFSVPMWMALACLVALLVFYPNRVVKVEP